MLTAIFSKEFYKIRWMWFIILILNIGVSLYVFITTRRLFLLDHPEIVWYRVIHLGQIYFDQFRYLPVISGILMACFQFLPEMWEERLKLSLHLPILPHRLIFYHLAVGCTALFFLILPDMLFLGGMTKAYFPPQMLETAFITAAPWFIGGFAAYLGVALVMLEPSLRLRASNALISFGAIGLFLKNSDPGVYESSIWFFLLPVVLMVFSVLYPAFRFRYRRAD